MITLTDAERTQAKVLAGRLIPTYRMEVFSGWTTKASVLASIAQSGTRASTSANRADQVMAQALRLVYKQIATSSAFGN